MYKRLNIPSDSMLLIVSPKVHRQTCLRNSFMAAFLKTRRNASKKNQEPYDVLADPVLNSIIFYPGHGLGLIASPQHEIPFHGDFRRGYVCMMQGWNLSPTCTPCHDNKTREVLFAGTYWIW